MTSGIKKRQLRSGKDIQLLTLVYSAGATPDPLCRQTLSEVIESANKKTATQVTNALICRLQIPHTPTIIGMLGVGLSRSNFDELLKWVARELLSVDYGDKRDAFLVLEQKFRQAVGQFPED